MTMVATLWRDVRYFASVPWNWLLLTFHNSWGILNVLDIIWLRPMPGGLIDERHPFCTGLHPKTSKPIWNSNVIFRSKRRDNLGAEPDHVIIERVGHHLRKQVVQASSSPQHPQGRPSRMPPGILYLHGGVHYNGGWLLFNDFQEAIEHFSNPRFAAEFRRFVREERREPITVFRQRNYDRHEFARFVCFMRTIFPWFSNSNGPKKFVLWGNPSPYAAVNTITGHWKTDCRLLKTCAGREIAARPPIVGGTFFQNGPYPPTRSTTRWPENFLALFTDIRIRCRRHRENLYFVDKRKLRRGFRFGPEPILSPWQRLMRLKKHNPSR